MTHKENKSTEIKNTSNMNKESFLERLADFDFSSSVQVNIIFEDDEDQSSTNEVEIKPEKAETADYTKCSIKNFPDKIESQVQEKTEIVPPKGVIQSSPCTASTVPINETKKNSDFRFELKSDKNLKRKLDDHTFRGSKNLKNVTEIDNASTSNASHGEQFISTHRTAIFREDFTNNNIAFDNDNADNLSTEMTCITNLLKSVSGHLILILDAYVKYLQLKDRAVDLPQKEKYLSQFRQVKYHFFNLSFCTVDNIILPQEKNLLFTGQFLNDTVKLAASQNRTLCLETQVAPLFLELLSWSKQKKFEINKIQSVNNTEYIQINNPLLRQHLAKSAKTTASTAVNDDSNFSLNIQHQGIQKAAVGNLKRFINYTLPNLPSNQLRVQNEDNSLHGDLNRSQTNSNCQRIQPTISSNIHPHNLNRSGITNETIHPPAQYMNEMCNTSANPIKYTQRRIEKPHTEVGTKTNISPRKTSTESVVFSTGPPESRISISVNQSVLDTCGNTNNSVTCGNMTNETEPFYTTESVLPPSYFETMIRRNQPNQHDSANNIQRSMPVGCHSTMSKMTPPWLQSQYRQDCHGYVQMQQAPQVQSIQAQAEQQHPEMTRSLSTDSGFMSPLNFNNPLETNKDAIEDNQLPSPMITHITSLHPNVSYIREGPCSVCGNTTRKMCVGCYKQYYCSNSCQRFDWGIHKVICRNS